MSPPVFAAVVLVFLGLRGAAAHRAPFAFINPSKFIQHDPRVEGGLEGFKRFVAGLPADTKVNTVRIFADGDYVVAHSEFTVSAGPQLGFDIFRFENGRIVEHWDVLQPLVSREQSKNPNGEF